MNYRKIANLVLGVFIIGAWIGVGSFSIIAAIIYYFVGLSFIASLAWSGITFMILSFVLAMIYINSSSYDNWIKAIRDGLNDPNKF